MTQLQLQAQPSLALSKRKIHAKNNNKSRQKLFFKSQQHCFTKTGITSVQNAQQVITLTVNVIQNCQARM